jgi:hypothetical protein
MALTAMKDKKGIGGRKPLWETLSMESKLDSVQGWALQGSTDEDIYTMLGVSEKTFYDWKRKYPQFAQSLKKGKYISNGELLNSAFTQSIGFRYIDNVPVKVKDYAWFTNPQTNESELKQIEKIEVVEIERYQPPNPTMNIFMLKNRMSDDYKDKHEVDVKKEVTNIYEVNVRQAIQEDPEQAAALKLLFKRQTASSFGEAMANTSE